MKRGVSALLYDTGLAYVDSLVGRLLQELDARGLLDKSVVVLLADHGEAFGEHGRFGHNSTAYREMMRVPLAFHLPSGCGVAPRRRSEVFATTDLMPTLLDLFQIPLPATMQGRSRLALLAGEQEETAGFAVSRALGEDRTGGKQKPEEVSYALRVPRYTLLLADRGRRVELYDREADPGELNDIADERPEVVKKLQAQFAAWADSQRGRPVVLPGGRVFAVVGKESDIDDTTRRQLKSLGYLK
jgi:arylsulfatase A-like enzyme